MSRHTIIIALLTLGCSAVEMLAWSRFLRGGDSLSAAALHLAAATVMAVACVGLLRGFSFSSRITLLIFLAAMTAALPLAGVPVAGLLTILLNTPAGDGEGPEDAVVFGNPPAQQARRESREKMPCLLPLAEQMRSLDEKETERMLHGLRHMSPPRKTLHFLRRFQTDPRSSLQFASQAILYAESELREIQIKDLQARVAEQPQNPEPKIQMAETLLSLAERTPDGDSTALVYFRDALAQLDAAAALDQRSSRIQLLQSRCLLGLAQPARILPLLDAVELRQGRSPQSAELRLQALQSMGDFPALRAAAQDAAAAGDACLGGAGSDDLAEAIAFWAKPSPAAI